MKILIVVQNEVYEEHFKIEKVITIIFFEIRKDWFDPSLRDEVKWDPYFLAITFGALSIISGIIIQPSLFYAMEIGHKLRYPRHSFFINKKNKNVLLYNNININYIT